MKKQTLPRVLPLNQEMRSHLPTSTAAWHLGCSPKNLRIRAVTGRLPIKPLHVGSRLLWPVAELRAILGV